MKPIKEYFRKWDVSRIVRAVLAFALGISYYLNRDFIFLFVGIMLALQAVFNLGCPGGSCAVKSSEPDEPIAKFKRYDPKNTKQDV